MTEKTMNLFWNTWGVSAGASAVVFPAMGAAGYVDALPVLFSMLVSFPDALGVLIPQLFPVPALAVLLALQKK